MAHIHEEEDEWSIFVQEIVREGKPKKSKEEKKEVKSSESPKLKVERRKSKSLSEKKKSPKKPAQEIFTEATYTWNEALTLTPPPEGRITLQVRAIRRDAVAEHHFPLCVQDGQTVTEIIASACFALETKESLSYTPSSYQLFMDEDFQRPSMISETVVAQQFKTKFVCLCPKDMTPPPRIPKQQTPKKKKIFKSVSDYSLSDWAQAIDESFDNDVAVSIRVPTGSFEMISTEDVEKGTTQKSPTPNDREAILANRRRTLKSITKTMGLKIKPTKSSSNINKSQGRPISPSPTSSPEKPLSPRKSFGQKSFDLPPLGQELEETQVQKRPQKGGDRKKKVESIFFSPSNSGAPQVKASAERRKSFGFPFFQKGTIGRARQFLSHEIDPTEIIKKGILMTRSGIRKNWKQKICILTNDAIRFYQKEEQVQNSRPKLTIMLSEIRKLTRVGDETTSKKFCFRFASPTGETICQATSEEDLEDWLTKVRSFIQNKGNEDESEESVIYLGRYETGRVIGVGGYAEVRIGKDLKTNKKVAIKVIKKDLSDKKMLERLEREISFLCCMDHPNIVKLYDVINKEETAILIMEFVEGETLDDFIYDMKGSCLPDYVSRFLFQKILSAVQYCHNSRVVHRDLKMENIIVNSRGDLWLIDFGLSSRWQPGIELQTFCGTLEYAAPEVVSKEKAYEGGPCDIWSLGVILFLMLTGNFPFEEDNLALLLGKIQGGHTDIDFPSSLSEDAVSLLKSIFVADPKKRASLKDILNHPWMKATPESTEKAQNFLATLE